MIRQGMKLGPAQQPLANLLSAFRQTSTEFGITLMNRYYSLFHNSVSSLVDRSRSAFSNSSGITLMETVIALALFSTVGVAVLMGVRAAHTSSDRVNASAVAENLARNQMEYVYTLPYVAPSGAYASVANDQALNFSIPSGFAVSAAAQNYVSDSYTGTIEKVVVTVTRDGQSVLILESLRTGP